MATIKETARNIFMDWRVTLDASTRGVLTWCISSPCQLYLYGCRVNTFTKHTDEVLDITCGHHTTRSPFHDVHEWEWRTDSDVVDDASSAYDRTMKSMGFK